MDVSSSNSSSSSSSNKENTSKLNENNDVNLEQKPPSIHERMKLFIANYNNNNNNEKILPTTINSSNQIKSDRFSPPSQISNNNSNKMKLQRRNLIRFQTQVNIRKKKIFFY